MVAAKSSNYKRAYVYEILSNGINLKKIQAVHAN